MASALQIQAFLQALGDINRLAMIGFIGANDCSVSQIIDAVKLSQPLVSHHLRILRENRIVSTTRKGPFVYYKLSDIRIIDLLKQVECIIPADQEPAN